MKRILIMEDDESIQKELVYLLSSAGYEAIVLENFLHAKEDVLKINPDLLLLDITLPYLHGELFLKELRKDADFPVIMVTSRSQEADEVLSMSYGADDYITKPYHPTILLLRIAAILRRTEGGSDVGTYQELKIYFQKGMIAKGEEEVPLTKNEMLIFAYLYHHQGRIVTRDELMTDLWNSNEFINDNALTVNMSRLRGKLKELGYEDAIITRKGQGYMLV